MATLLELAALPDDTRWSDFVNQIRAACVKKAAAIISTASPGEAAKDWAKSCLSHPGEVANQIVYGVIGLADNAVETVPVNAIFNASEADIQTYVDASVDKLYGV